MAIIDKPIQEFKLPPEQQAIRDKCFHPSGTFVEFPVEDVETSIPARFEKIVRMYPERVAIKTAKRSMTYAELNKAANRLANRILKLRGEVQEVVCFSHAHGILPIISHLAVLKAGKISVELDPTAPASRNAYIMRDSTATLLLIDNNSGSAAAGWTSPDQTLLNLDELDSNPDDRSQSFIRSTDEAAYIRYTSGSTGQSKGAVKSHRQVLHEVMVATNCFRLCNQDRISHLSRESMGKFVFSALLNGSTLYPLDTTQDGWLHLADWLRREGITTYQSFPTAYRYFTSSLNGHERFPNLRLIRLEGELLYRRDLELFKKYFSTECVLVNVYSSAETGTVSSYFMDRNTELTGNRIPMGYPLQGKLVSVRDDQGNEAGINKVGEIAVKSLMLSSGYWRRPEITRLKFIKDPTEPCQQIYLTGDLGSVSEDGLLQHFGRKDAQIKIRGCRVDAGEVEAMLTEHEGVRESVVVVQDDQLGNNELVAYIVTQNDVRLNASTLRDFLHEKLPAYMIPAHFVTVGSIPLTATGKVDRRQLASLNNLRLANSGPYTAPRNIIEERVAAIWQEILSLERISVNDNFFELGGHSLSATQVISRIRDAFNLNLPFKVLFEAQTIAALAQQVQAHGSGTSAAEHQQISRTNREHYKA